MITPFKPLKASDKLRIAYANGVRTASEYARYKHRNKSRTNTFPMYMNRAIESQIEKER